MTMMKCAAFLSLLWASGVHGFSLLSCQPSLTTVSQVKNHHQAVFPQSPVIRGVTTSTIQLRQSSASTEDNSVPAFGFNVKAAAVFASLTVWGFLFAPGQLGAPADAAIIDAIKSNPTDPGINELFYLAFNLFLPVPLILAALLLPQGRPKGLPAAPFLLASSGIGFFGLGPYMTLRSPPREAVTQEELSWFTGNVTESKAFGWAMVLLLFWLPIGAHVLEAYQQDPAGLWQGFVELVSSSRFCSVTFADLLSLYCLSVAVIPGDYLLRKPEADDGEALNVAAAAAALPLLGSALYLAFRPSLPSDDE